MLDVALYLVTLLSTFFAGIISLQNNKAKKFPFLTVGMCVMLAVCLLLQFVMPDLLTEYERNTSAIQAKAWWRILTALFFQDGGLQGGVSNILFLAMIGSIAEQIQTKKWWIVVYFVSGLATEYIALLWQPVGAGNSIAYFGLAGSIVAYVLLERKNQLATMLGVVSVLAALLLLLQQNIHGPAFVAGMLLYFLIRMCTKV